MRILVLGSGLIGPASAYNAMSDPEVLQVTLCDIDPQQLDRDEKNLPVGIYDGGQLTLGEYLSNLPRLPEAQRPDFDNYDSLQEVIFQMSLMDILRVEAEKLGYDESDQYKEKVKRFRELAMADIMRNDTIPASVDINEGQVQEYYDTHQDEFTVPARYHLLEIQFDHLDSAQKFANRLKAAMESKNGSGAMVEYQDLEARFVEALENDLDTPLAIEAIGALGERLLAGGDGSEARQVFRRMGSVVGLRLDLPNPERSVADGWMEHLRRFQDE